MLIRVWTGLLLLLLTSSGYAITFNIAPGSRAILIQIGAAGASINKVTFTLTAANAADGTSIVAAPAVLMNVAARDVVPLAIQVVADSSTPLINGAATLPFTHISWTASDADIPSGAFTGAAAQLIVTFPTNIQMFNFHTFSYANTQVLQPGTYSGRVTYTITMP